MPLAGRSQRTPHHLDPLSVVGTPHLHHQRTLRDWAFLRSFHLQAPISPVCEGAEFEAYNRTTHGFSCTNLVRKSWAIHL
jgi:hypothetical protein